MISDPMSSSDNIRKAHSFLWQSPRFHLLKKRFVISPNQFSRLIGHHLHTLPYFSGFWSLIFWTQLQTRGQLMRELQIPVLQSRCMSVSQTSRHRHLRCSSENVTQGSLAGRADSHGMPTYTKRWPWMLSSGAFACWPTHLRKNGLHSQPGPAAPTSASHASHQYIKTRSMSGEHILSHLLDLDLELF